MLQAHKSAHKSNEKERTADSVVHDKIKSQSIIPDVVELCKESCLQIGIFVTC